MTKTRLRIQEIATQKNLNISQLSRKADLDIALVRRYWHNRVQSVSIPALEAIAQALEVKVTELIDDNQAVA